MTLFDLRIICVTCHSIVYYNIYIYIYIYIPIYIYSAHLSFYEVGRIISLSRSEWGETSWAESSVAVGRNCFGPNHLGL